MDTFDDIKDFVKSMKAEIMAVEIVLLNAEVYNFVYKKSLDGLEDDLEVNLLSNTLLGLLLLPWMSVVKKPGQIHVKHGHTTPGTKFTLALFHPKHFQGLVPPPNTA